MRRTRLPARDLRILDPLLSYPSTVLGRERAIVINLEHIKAIITAQEVLLLNSQDPSVTPFVDELQRRVLLHYQANQSKVFILNFSFQLFIYALGMNLKFFDFNRVIGFGSRSVLLMIPTAKSEELHHKIYYQRSHSSKP